MCADPAPWRRQSSQISGNGTSNPSPGPPPGAPPPPPPAYATGGIPSVRIPTEMSCRKEPPAAIQNAMMTKDKKPFTYTPGGLDLNEIRSPRMAKRISRNAHLEDRYDHPDIAQMHPQQVQMMQQYQQQMPQTPSQHMPQMPMTPSQHVPQMPMTPSQHMPQMPMTPSQHMPQMPMTPSQHMPQMPMTPSQHMPQMPLTPSQHLSQMTQMPPMGQHQMAVAPQTPRGWSPVNSPPLQSRSFRVLQKITGSDQEAFGEKAKSDGDVVFLVNRVQPQKEVPAYSEMMSPPVQTMPSYPPHFYNMRSPTYNSNGHPGESEY